MISYDRDASWIDQTTETKLSKGLKDRVPKGKERFDKLENVAPMTAIDRSFVMIEGTNFHASLDNIRVIHQNVARQLMFPWSFRLASKFVFVLPVRWIKFGMMQRQSRF